MEQVSLSEGLFHFAVVFWKVLFAIVPPVRIGGAWPSFFVSLALIGWVTSLVSSAASQLGCRLGMPDSITAITIVALGTSLPDTFASVAAAQMMPFADSAVGNVTGSNCVNVFLGLGLPWIIAAHYNAGSEKGYHTPAGNLAFSVVVFISVAIIALITLYVRRIVIGGELGGPRMSAYASAIFLVSLWFVYIIMSILKTGGNV